jgi:2-polyprenyl-6-methoxyphenol hydroxylase-like FAD-dependent oxidoreductase
MEIVTDVVVIGAGIGGGAASCVLARAGLGVLVLEKTEVHRDVVRGEWLAPWGVAEAETLGLIEDYLSAGAHRVARHVSYSEFVPSAEADTLAIPLATLAPRLPLCMGHPKTCDLLNDRAVAAGATLLRGVQRIRVAPGAPPTVTYVHEDGVHTVRPRWVIGADGRNGLVARQIGCRAYRDPEDHLFSGMLVSNAHGWPEDLQAVATEGDVNVLAFPQGGGRVRIYLGWPSADRGRLVGPGGQQRFLDAWRLGCVAHADAIVGATPASPCIAYPNSDAWVDSPVREGVVLIGDAAGRNDPIIGQGLSITHRDVRMVCDALLGDRNWSIGMFDGYVVERTQRMRHLRTIARLTTLRESVFGERGRRMRAAIHERLSRNPALAMPFLGAFVGPDQLPGEVLSDAFAERIAGGPIWDGEPVAVA